MAYTFKHGDRPLDGYTIQRAVGCGGFGEVYYALSDGGREVALKYLKSNPAIELRGVSHCINLKSPYLVSIFDVKKNADGEYFVIMEYCSGPSLRDLMIAEPDGFGPQKSAFFVREIAKGLAYLHDQGIVHRDMKPGNIFFDDGYVKIGDYGLSKFISVSRHSAQTASVGTVHYMAPEIGSGNYSAGVDIYALGVMLYEMLLGRVPFEGSSMGEILMKHLTAQPELDELPHPFGEVILKSLQKDPKDRYQSANEMIEALLEVDEVRQSLAGFSVKSLAGAVNHGPVAGASSPIPSPNPIPRDAQGNYPPPPPRLRGRKPRRLTQPTGEFTSKRVSKRHDRIARKIDKKMAKLSGGRLPKRQTQAYAAASRRAGESPGDFVARQSRRKRMLLCMLASAALAVTSAIIFGNVEGSSAPYGIATGMMVIAMSGGIGIGRKTVRWFAAEDGPRWANALLRICSCAPLLFMAGIPMLANHRTNDEGLVVVLALLIVIWLGKWNKPFERGNAGELSLGSAIWTGFGGMMSAGIVTAMMDSGTNEIVMPTCAVIAGSVSLIIQMSSWWIGTRRPIMTGDKGTVATEEAPVTKDQDNGILVAGLIIGGDSDAKTSVPVSSSHTGPGAPNAHLRRWGITRVMWGMMSFCSACGALALSLVMGLHDDFNPGKYVPIHIYESTAESVNAINLVTSSAHTISFNSGNYDDVTGMIIGLIACVVFSIYAASKTTPLCKEGFWLNTFKPFMVTLLTFGIGALITAIARNWDFMSSDQEARIGMVFGLVTTAIAWLVIVLFTGRKSRPQPAFVQPNAVTSPETPSYAATPANDRTD